MYPYHNQILMRVNNGEMTGYHYTNDYPKIGECLVLEFNTFPFTRPIRPHAYYRYLGVLEKFDQSCK